MTKIYQLRDPNTNQVRYIGKTTKELWERLAYHINSIYRSRKFPALQNWILELLKSNKIPIIELLETTTSGNENFLEKLYIEKAIKEKVCLLNIIYTNNKEYFDYHSKIHSIIIYQYDLEGYFIAEWKSILDAANYYGLDSSNLSSSAKGGRKLAGIYQWRYFKADKISSYIRTIHRKKVYEYDYEGNYVQEHIAVSLIEGIKPKLISKCCNGTLKSIYKRRFSFEKVDKLNSCERKIRKDKGTKKIIKDIVQSL